MPDQSLGGQLIALGWQSGSVLLEDMHAKVIEYMKRHGDQPPNIENTDWLILVSQTCDVVAENLDLEPYVEILQCRKIDNLRPEYIDLRSTRTLDFCPNKDVNPAIALTAHAVRDRHLIPRFLLIESLPDQNRILSITAIRRLQYWYALRYSRPAWPNNFVKRFNPAIKKLRKALKQLTEDIAEVRVSINPNEDELSDADNYAITVFFIVDQTVWNDSPAKRELINSAFAKFISALKSCEGIKVNEELSNVLPGEDFNWQLMKTTDEWNFANLSPLE